MVGSSSNQPSLSLVDKGHQREHLIAASRYAPFPAEQFAGGGCAAPGAALTLLRLPYSPVKLHANWLRRY